MRELVEQEWSELVAQAAGERAAGVSPPEEAAAGLDFGTNQVCILAPTSRQAGD
jgi:hypothetical protein